MLFICVVTSIWPYSVFGKLFFHQERYIWHEDPEQRLSCPC